MKENKNNSFREELSNNRTANRSFIARFIFTFHWIDLFQSSKAFGKNIPIRFANLRV